MSASANPPRENLVRALSRPPELVRSEGSDMPVLRGHFAVWDTFTEIRSSYEGHFLERFATSSMDKTITEGRDRMKVLFQHGKDPQIADKPLGPISRLEPDDTGAYYEVPLLDTSYNRDLIPGLENGLYGASFRFQVISEEFNKKPRRSDFNPSGLPERTVTEAKVIEFGPVTFPAYAQATAGLRSMTDEFVLGRFADDEERLEELLTYERLLRGNGRPTQVTITYGRNIGDDPVVEPEISAADEQPEPEDMRDDTAADVLDVEPERSDATTPAVEPEPSEATTRSDRDLFWFAATPKNTRSK